MTVPVGVLKAFGAAVYFSLGAPAVGFVGFEAYLLVLGQSRLDHVYWMSGTVEFISELGVACALCGLTFSALLLWCSTWRVPSRRLRCALGASSLTLLPAFDVVVSRGGHVRNADLLGFVLACSVGAILGVALPSFLLPRSRIGA